MKNSLQLIILLILPLFLTSCSNEEEIQEEAITEAPMGNEATEEAKSPTETAADKMVEKVATEISENITEKIEAPADEKLAYQVLINAIDKSAPGWKQSLSLPEMLSFDADKAYYWDMKTNKGDMSFRLFHDSAPMHVSSTIFLTESGFYDDVLFHRVIPGFMAQGGDPTGTGRGGPGYKYAGEFEGASGHTKPGMLSMANAGPNTDGSQFFITFVPTPFLNGKHTVFGEIVSGQQTLKTLEQFGSGGGATSETLKIEKASIRVE